MVRSGKSALVFKPRLGSLTFARLYLSLNVALGLVGIDRIRVESTELTAQWYVTPSGDKLISYYGPEEECELYGSWATVNQTMETIRGEMNGIPGMHS